MGRRQFLLFALVLNGNRKTLRGRRWNSSQVFIFFKILTKHFIPHFVFLSSPSGMAPSSETGELSLFVFCGACYLIARFPTVWTHASGDVSTFQ